ncbi:Putative Mn2+ efflux pump MntP [Lachnospiraceae bacterium KH1T2]|nr:Putative Mn2+ efflux pump MntP [Lachnospiraceae bacterium KH1T2]
MLNFLFIFKNVMLGVGLAMDAFTVSIANGLNEPHMRARKTLCIAGAYGFFQWFMPMVGWLCVHTIVTYFSSFEKFIPWIALILLAWIGGKMIFESLSHKDEEEFVPSRLNFTTLVIQGIATSIDALSVGFTIASYDLAKACVSSVIIAVVTFLICMVGLHLGKTLGEKLSGKAEILGGIILIAIGLEIFIQDVFL